MRAWARIRLRCRSLFQRARVEEQLDSEFEFHLEQQIAEFRAAGLSPADARRAALASFGGVPQYKEQCRDMRRLNLLDDFLHDVRYGARMFRRSPGFCAIVILTLSLGIGANTAIFSFIDAILFRPPMAADPTGLISVFTTTNTANQRRAASSYRDFVTLESSARSLTTLAAHSRVPLDWAGTEHAEVIWGIVATPRYFAAFGIPSRLGRGFDERDAAAPVAVLSDRFWRDRLQADESVLGRKLQLGGRDYTVIGVMPAGFRGDSPTFEPALWLPLQAWNGITREELDRPSKQWLAVSARLAPGATPAAARAELAALSAHLDPLPDRPEVTRSLVPLTYREVRLSADRTFAFIALILSAVVLLVLLIASANVAGLLLARTLGRRKEIALRQSLGASRFRIVRQLLAESLLLAAAGAAGGALAAAWALRLLAAWQAPFPTPLRLDARLDLRTLAFTAILAAATSILFGLMPAIEAARTDLIGRIRRQRRAIRGMEVLVAMQVASGVVLMTGAWLFVEALGRASQIDPGFRPEHALAMTLDPSLRGLSRDQSIAAYRQLLERARAIPGVQSAGLAQNIPLGNGLSTVAVTAAGGDARHPTTTRYNTIDGDFFPAIGTRILRGRPFLPSDTASAPPVVIVNEFLARTLWQGREAIGQILCIETCSLVVGVAEQGKYFTLAEDPSPHVWLPFAQRYASPMTVIIRTAGEPAAFAAPLRQAAGAVPVLEMKTLREHMRIPLLEPQLPSFFLSVLSAIGLFLTLAGIFGVTAHSVGSRTREVGIRMAIGATRAQVLLLFVRRALSVCGAAILCGLALAAVFGKLVVSLLYGIDPAAPLRLAAVALIMSLAMLLGAFLPAASATRVDPAITLREE